ncbi:hypothetical protein COR50_10210 [Chitinophaga caeni]|uniref:BZIP transcription factor n=1 Tax=Chitinophaga caeni TaxID=2029983 RepID=A0A291QUB7_9BACT|nr:hypothetical protein [Chitinophaga caeni]ATL47511.1 hypothetical protein COR50_10210 [Chitinophaga caeni]
MKRLSFSLLCMLSLFVSHANNAAGISNRANEAAFVGDTVLPYNPTNWINIGVTNDNFNDYALYYYKIAKINDPSHRYNTLLEISIEADPNYADYQGTYLVHISKFENVTNRFGGIHIKCTSGNPNAGKFYVYNNELWVTSNNKWGHIFMRTVADFTNFNPRNEWPYDQTKTAPTGFIKEVAYGNENFDFVNNVTRPMPYTDKLGDHYTFGNFEMKRDKFFGYALNDNFVYKGKTMPHYGFQYTLDTSWATAGMSYWLSAYAGIKFMTRGYARMAIDFNGNVGIGTNSPQSLLSVNGTITAKKVKVLSGGWSDFVFEPGYRFPSLYELEQYIQKHQHLPGIPSATEVAKDGIDVADINKKLLQKVEEISLYLIEHQKEIDALKEENQRLKKEVLALKHHQ